MTSRFIVDIRETEIPKTFTNSAEVEEAYVQRSKEARQKAMDWMQSVDPTFNTQQDVFPPIDARVVALAIIARNVSPVLATLLRDPTKKPDFINQVVDASYIQFPDEKVTPDQKT